LRAAFQGERRAADRAANSPGRDLVTEMVREFTELQGIVGGSTQNLKENLKKSPGPSTTTTSLPV
jgi:glycyl-tRNA synthetase beta subunit